MQLLLLMAGAALGAPLADCPRTYDTGEVLDAADSAELAFGRQDAAGFDASRQALRARIECSADILSRAAVARIHRVEALGAFLVDETPRIPQALAGVFAAEPGHQIPSALLPDGHPVRALVANATTALLDDPGLELPRPASGWIEVDGTHALRAPTQRAALLQQIDGQGLVVATHYRWPEDADFAWVVGELAVATGAAHAPATKRAPSPWARRAPLLAGAALSVAASAALYGLAAGEHAEFTASPTLGGSATAAERDAYRAELEGMQMRANGFTYGCYAAAGVGVALGVVAGIAW